MQVGRICRQVWNTEQRGKAAQNLSLMRESPLARRGHGILRGQIQYKKSRRG
jgi:hypothetical protein